jgi:hypothetical protein
MNEEEWGNKVSWKKSYMSFYLNNGLVDSEGWTKE